MIEERYSVSIDKPFLGDFLAIEILRLSRRDPRVLHGGGLLRGTEISRFLRFIMDWSEEEAAGEPDDEIYFDV